MHIIVLIKQVPLSSEVMVDPETGVIIREGSDGKMNPYDLFALETVFRIREQYDSVITAVTMGPLNAQDILREALYMGADEACLLSDRACAGSDVLATSYALSQIITSIGPADLIICGKQTTDGDTGQVGAECSEFLDIPYLSNVTDIISVGQRGVEVVCDTGAYEQQVISSYPLLISVEKDIYQPRLPSYRRKKRYREHTVKILTLADLPDPDPDKYGLNGSPTQVVQMFNPESKASPQVWDGAKLGEKLYSYLADHKYLEV